MSENDKVSALAENCRSRRNEEGGGGWRVTELQFADYIAKLETQLDTGPKTALSACNGGDHSRCKPSAVCQATAGQPMWRRLAALETERDEAQLEAKCWKGECLDALKGTDATSVGGLIADLRAQLAAADLEATETPTP